MRKGLIFLFSGIFMKKLLAVIVLFLIGLMPHPSALAQGFGAFPISQAIEVSAGRSTTLDFELLNFGAEPMVLDVTHSYVASQLSEEQIMRIGNLRLRQLMLERPKSHGEWMTVPEEIKIEAAGSGGPTLFQIPIDVPTSASGTIAGTIIFTQQTDALLRLAYRCSYLLTVTNRPKVREITIEDLQIEQVAGTTEFSATVTNIGNTSFELDGDYAVFRQVGLRKIPVLKDSITPVNLQPGQPTSVYKPLSGNLASGRYEIRLMASLNGTGQRPRVAEFDFEGPFDAGSTIDGTEVFAGPNLSVASLTPRARRNIPFFIENPTDEPITVSLSLPAQTIPGLKFQMVPESLTISPASSGRFRLMIQAEADFAMKASQTVVLSAEISSSSGSTARHDLTLLLSTPDAPPQSDAAVESATLDLTSGTLRFDLRNTGNMPLSPMGSGLIYVRADQPLTTFDFRVDTLMAPEERMTMVIELDTSQREDLRDLSALSSAIDSFLGLRLSHPKLSRADLISTDLSRQ